MVGWPTEKTGQKAYIQLERDTEEMVNWRSMSLEEIDDIWKSWQEILKNCWENTLWRPAKEEPKEKEVSLRNGGWPGELRNIGPGNGVKICWARISSWFREFHLQRTAREERRQQRMKVMKDTTRKIRSEGRMDANDSWWVRELLAAHCEKASRMGRRMEVEHQKLVSRMIKSADGSTSLSHKITEPTAWRGGGLILKKEGEDARLWARCEEKEQEWAKHWQCGEGVQDVKDKPWRNDESKKLEETCRGWKK